MNDRERNRKSWPAVDAAIDELADEALPLNAQFANGEQVRQWELLQHVAALERRIARLEAKDR